MATKSNLKANSFAEHLINSDQFSFVHINIDPKQKITGVFGDLAKYGFNANCVGENAASIFDFLNGLIGNQNSDLDVKEKLELPLLETPSGIHANILITPIAYGNVNLLISDASTEYNQLQLLQQKANEVELLTKQQSKLLTKLEQANRLVNQQNQELEEANRLQTDFLAGVSHEFRTPLFSILGYNDLLQKTAPESAKQHTKSIQRAGKHLMSLVENLLDYGKIGSNKFVLNPSTLSINEVLNDIEILLTETASNKGIKLNFTSDIASNTLAFSDEMRLRQCLINIIGNAIKFTDSGSVSVDSKYQDEHLSVSVKDTGIGIAKDQLDKVYKSFWQAGNTGKVGAGLGLSITKDLIELLGGQIQISSELGKGTTVSLNLLLPEIESNEIDVAQTPVLEELGRTKNFNILMAEDDNDIAELLKVLLQETGYCVEHVKNGEEVLTQLKEETYNLLLLDVHMPKLNGIETIRKLRAENNQIPIVIMTASTHEREREKAIEVGCNAYIVKPIEMAALEEVISEVTSRHTNRDEI